MGNAVYQGGNILLSGTAVSAQIPNPYDNQANSNFAYLYYSAAGASAIVDILASHNRTAWMPVLTVTAVTGGIGLTAQISAFYPYVAARTNLIYSGAAGTGQPFVYWSPGFV